MSTAPTAQEQFDEAASNTLTAVYLTPDVAEQREKVLALLSPKTGERALDIGCAAGYFMDVLKADGWQVEGIELDESMRRTPQERGYTVFDQPLEVFQNSHQYDLITLFDVIEHLPGLQADVAKMAGMLAPNGCIALVTPDIESVQRRLCGAKWFQFKPTEHIYYFSPSTLRQLFEPHGIDVVLLKRAGQYADVSFSLVVW